jgi:hypothetical protein
MRGMLYCVRCILHANPGSRPVSLIPEDQGMRRYSSTSGSGNPLENGDRTERGKSSGIWPITILRPWPGSSHSSSGTQYGTLSYKTQLYEKALTTFIKKSNPGLNKHLIQSTGVHVVPLLKDCPKNTNQRIQSMLQLLAYRSKTYKLLSRRTTMLFL